MKGITFQRVLKSGVVNFFRNGLVSIATVLVMSLSLLMLSSVLLGSVFFSSFIQNLQEKVDISVYFRKDASESAISELRGRIEGLPTVKGVVYVSRDEALKRFLDRHKGEELITRSIEVIEDNPFSASLEINATDPSHYDAITKFIEQGTYQDLIDLDSRGQQKITYRQNQEVIDKLTTMLRTARAIGLWVGIFLAMVAIVVAYNTVRLAIYNSRDEISVMQLVGASRSFIRGPFLVEGVFHGIIATIVTMVALYPALWWIGTKTARVFGGLNVFSYFVSNIFQMAFIVLILGIVLGVISSQLAIRRYLHV